MSAINALPYHCGHCFRYFKVESLYKTHKLTCKYFRSGTKDETRERDSHEEVVPSARELFKYVQHLAARCESMAGEIARLKEAVAVGSGGGSRRAAAAVAVVEEPDVWFDDWIDAAGSEDGDAALLEEVWLGELFSGMKLFFQNELAVRGASGLPIRCSSSASGGGAGGGNPRTAFSVYDHGAWRTMHKEDWRRCVDKLDQRLLQAYLKSCEAEEGGGGGGDSDPTTRRAREMACMLKISDAGSCVGARIKKVRQWMVDNLGREN